MQEGKFDSDTGRKMLAKFYGEEEGGDQELENFFVMVGRMIDEREVLNKDKTDDRVLEMLKQMREKIKLDKLKEMAYEGRKMLKENPGLVEEVFSRAGVNIGKKREEKVVVEVETSSAEEEGEEEETSSESDGGEEEKTQENMVRNMERLEIIEDKTNKVNKDVTMKRDDFDLNQIKAKIRKAEISYEQG
jgi:hypothetical protein